MRRVEKRRQRRFALLPAGRNAQRKEDKANRPPVRSQKREMPQQNPPSTGLRRHAPEFPAIQDPCARDRPEQEQGRPERHEMIRKHGGQLGHLPYGRRVYRNHAQRRAIRARQQPGRSVRLPRRRVKSQFDRHFRQSAPFGHQAHILDVLVVHRRGVPHQAHGPDHAQRLAIAQNGPPNDHGLPKRPVPRYARMQFAGKAGCCGRRVHGHAKPVPGRQAHVCGVQLHRGPVGQLQGGKILRERRRIDWLRVQRLNDQRRRGNAPGALDKIALQRSEIVRNAVQRRHERFLTVQIGGLPNLSEAGLANRPRKRNQRKQPDGDRQEAQEAPPNRKALCHDGPGLVGHNKNIITLDIKLDKFLCGRVYFRPARTCDASDCATKTQNLRCIPRKRASPIARFLCYCENTCVAQSRTS